MNLDTLALRISELGPKGAAALYAEMAKLGEEMAVSIRTSLDSGIPGPQSRTGALAASVASKTEEAPGAVVTTVGVMDGPKYAAYLEYGTGPGRIYPRTAEALRFVLDGHVIFAKSVRPVRAYRFVGRSLDEVRPTIEARLSTALTAAIYGT